jgi:hypothetical protein
MLVTRGASPPPVTYPCPFILRRKRGRTRRKGNSKVLGGALAGIISLVLVFWNARGIGNKEVELKAYLGEADASYAGISESRAYNDTGNLSDGTWKWEAGTEGRPVTNSGASRGMGAFVNRNKVKASVVDTGRYTMWHRVELEGDDCLIIGLGYFPNAQDLTGHADANAELLGKLLHFCKKGHVVFGGDLNAHTGLAGDDVDAAGTMLLDTIERAGMLMVNDMQGVCVGTGGPTREQVREDGTQRSTIDYVLITPSLAKAVVSMTVEGDQMGSDHKPLKLSLSGINTIRPNPVGMREVWNVSDIPSPPDDWSWVNACRSKFANWIKEGQNMINVLEAVNTEDHRIADIMEWSFQLALDEMAAEHLGTKVVGPKAVPTMDAASRLLVSQRAVAEDIMKRVMADDQATDQTRAQARAQFLRAGRAVRKAASDRKAIKELEVFRDIEANQLDSKLFWGKFKALRGRMGVAKAPPPVAKDKEGRTATDPVEVLRIWRDFNSKIASGDLSHTKEEGIYDEDYKVEEEERLEWLRRLRYHQQELDHPITDDEVFQAIRKLKMGKAPGEDGILTDILKTAADGVNNSKLRPGNSVVNAITLLFNFVFDREVWPERWGMGVIIPLYKHDSRLEPGNYRPITLMSVVGKLFGIIVNNRLLNWSEATGTISDEQGGFRPKRGTPDQVFLWREILASRKERGHTTYATFIDVRKAYDTVWREKAYCNIHDAGVRGRLWRQLQTMHEGLSRKVRHPLGDTDPFDVSRGVAQGAVESPWVYSSFIEGLAKELKRSGTGIVIAGRRVPLLMYADDIVMLATSRKEMLEMNRIATEFAIKHRFQFNGSKSGVMVFNASVQERTNVKATRWVLFGDKVEVVNEYTYLGTVTVNDETDWRKHVKGAIVKAERRSADLLWVCRYDAGIRARTAMVLWYAMVRPLLEYASEIWSGQIPDSLATRAETVQLKFIRGVLGLHGNGSGVSNEVLRAEVGAEPITSRWAKLKLGFWRRIFTAPPERLLRVVATERHRELTRLVAGESKFGGTGWMRTVKGDFERYGMDQYWTNIDMCSVGKDDWSQTVYEQVDGVFDELRGERILDLPSAGTYTHIKDWGPTTKEYAYSRGELHRLGQYVPEQYLDDRTNMGGAHVKLMCRLNCLPVMDRVGREREPKWSKVSRTCLACDQSEVETVEHFVMECPRYDRHRAILFRDINRRLPSFSEMQTSEKLRVVLGRRTGRLLVDKAIDNMVKRRLKKFWNLRSPISKAINNVLKTSYWVSGALFKT